MTTYTLATGTSALTPAKVELVQTHNNRMFTSAMSGWRQTLSLPGARWGMVWTYPQQPRSARQAVEAWLTALSGMEHRASLYDPARPEPALLGQSNCIALTGVLCGAASQFATSLSLTNCGDTKTLTAGDWIAVTTQAGSQLLMVVANATSNSGGAMTVTVRHPLRAAVTGGAAVVTSSARGLFVLSSPEFAMPREAADVCPEFTVSFTEVFA